VAGVRANAPPKAIRLRASTISNYRSLTGHKALIATLMNARREGDLVTIERGQEKANPLTRTPETEKPATLTARRPEYWNSDVFSATKMRLTLGKAYDAKFHGGLCDIQKSLRRAYGSRYFKWK